METLLIQSLSQLATHIKALRQARGLTQAEIAARLKVTQSRYAQIERSPGTVSTARLLEILALLEADVVLKPRGGKAQGPSRPTRGEDW